MAYVNCDGCEKQDQCRHQGSLGIGGYMKPGLHYCPMRVPKDQPRGRYDDPRDRSGGWN